MSRAVKLVVDQLIYDLQRRPGDFDCSECVLRDRKAKLGFWIANCFFDAKIYEPYTLNFGFVQGWRFHQAVKKWKSAEALTQAGKGFDEGMER